MKNRLLALAVLLVLVAALPLLAQQISSNLYIPSIYYLILGGQNEADNVTLRKTGANAGTLTGSVAVTAGLTSATLGTATNCSSGASPAVCGSATAGSVAQAAAAGTLAVNTVAVTANSQIFVTEDSSLGTRLSVTCNTTPAAPKVSARTAGTNFTITSTAPTTNPRCMSYRIVN